MAPVSQAVPTNRRCLKVLDSLIKVKSLTPTPHELSRDVRAADYALDSQYSVATLDPPNRSMSALYRPKWLPGCSSPRCCITAAG